LLRLSDPGPLGSEGRKSLDCKKEVFFFEKKQKAFRCLAWCGGVPMHRTITAKSFLLLFFKKEDSFFQFILTPASGA
jgi:hypothetical protein